MYLLMPTPEKKITQRWSYWFQRNIRTDITLFAWCQYVTDGVPITICVSLGKF